MNEMFSQGGKGSTGILTNKQAVARHFGVKQSEVVYFSVGVDLSGYKVIYDKETQRAYSLPAGIAPGTTAISLSTAAVLVHSAGSVDLGALAVTREEYVTLPGSFSTGVTVNTKNELVVFTDGKYRWDGKFPKIVPASSNPKTSGGVGAGKWLSVGDTALRSEVYSNMAWVSPEMYGALDAISAADTQSLIDAFTTAKTMGVGVKLSRLYQCASNIELTAFISDVFGLGQGQTGIIFEPGCGFVVDNSSISGTRKAMRIINTSIRTRGAKDATALRFKGTHSAKYGEQLKLTDVLFATDETGEVITPAIEAGSRYGIRYEEMLVMEAAVQRRRACRLEERIAALEAKLL